ncbi:U2AG splicing factor U2AF U2snRNP auxilliary factor small subunit [Cryptosporidium canis]|uniref:U2AG splicing factor U2AF U2snRNP auxilliary factor small subunit n=1 Tax=Cryptosporidium canis TaxID=195482 RepID=A0A9D5DJ50_9CRYT|nr:U2AG splicing factor U2AF U2snRNP auxilliary factor small subunit [Cryptosporidium canis]
MAEHLARILGTEEDRVNCPFYWKIGACRHGEQCSRNHYKPANSPTVIMKHMYENGPIALAISEGQEVSDKLADEESDKVEVFYEEIFKELSKYGEVSELLICDNIGDHMIGNVYARFSTEDYAKSAMTNLRGKMYAGRPVNIELSPVSDFKEARCRQFMDGCCNRGGYCNFMHTKHVPRCVKEKLIQQMYIEHPEYLNRKKSSYKRSSGRDDWKSSESSRPRKFQRQSSEERRLMIESWNKHRENH